MTATEKKEQIRDVIAKSGIRWNADPIYLHYATVENIDEMSGPVFYLIFNQEQQGEQSLERYRNTFYSLSIQGHLPLPKGMGENTDKGIAAFETKIDELVAYLVNYRTPWPEERRIGILEETIVGISQVSPDDDVYIREKRFLTEEW